MQRPMRCLPVILCACSSLAGVLAQDASPMVELQRIDCMGSWPTHVAMSAAGVVGA